MIKVFAKIQFQGEKIQSLGKISYEVYLVHGFVIDLLKELYKNWRPGIFIVVVGAISLLASLFINRVAIKLIRIMRVG